MKKTIFVVGLFFVAAASLLVQPALSQGGGTSQTATPPPYCKPCLFYGGDFDASNPAANALSNGVIYQGSPAAVFVPFYVPPGQTWTITGLFSNNLSSSTFIDPAEIKWSISSGITTGNAGTEIAKGVIRATYTATGRSFDGLTEYTALGHLTPQTIVTLTQSGVYWMTASPICTDPSCGFANFYITDVEDVPAPNHKGVQPNDDSFYLLPNGGFFSRQLLIQTEYATVWGATAQAATSSLPASWGTPNLRIGRRTHVPASLARLGD